MTTKLKVLLDEAISGILAECIEEYSGLLSVLYVCDIPELRGTKDPDLLKHAEEDDRVLITVDSDFNHTSCPPCTHKGIIRIATRNKHEAIQGDALKRFLRSGHRAEVRNCVAYISDHRATIHTHKEITEYRF